MLFRDNVNGVAFRIPTGIVAAMREERVNANFVFGRFEVDVELAIFEFRGGIELHVAKCLRGIRARHFVPDIERIANIGQPGGERRNCERPACDCARHSHGISS